uniref:Uncharacterized protein n=1 Tax=Accipiter nisus TaxID=211598 RepID=A0A8B9NBG1_9AVES
MLQAIGPNRVINRQKKKKKRPRVKNPWASVTPEEYSFPTSESILTSEVEGEPKDDKPLWAVMQAAYQALNETNPNFTTSFWLCYDIEPPFYEGIALSSPYNTSTEESPS